jgi:hypothetical protein
MSSKLTKSVRNWRRISIFAIVHRRGIARLARGTHLSFGAVIADSGLRRFPFPSPSKRPVHSACAAGRFAELVARAPAGWAKGALLVRRAVFRGPPRFDTLSATAFAPKLKRTVACQSVGRDQTRTATTLTAVLGPSGTGTTSPSTGSPSALRRTVFPVPWRSTAMR